MTQEYIDIRDHKTDFEMQLSKPSIDHVQRNYLLIMLDIANDIIEQGLWLIGCDTSDQLEVVDRNGKIERYKHNPFKNQKMLLLVDNMDTFIEQTNMRSVA